ncbi:CXXC-20-CXXC protein [Sinobaca qinghaiensis]|uniref:CXXC-20-CXXC protein n=1 Tax=Sinobaca qinghaiensis TaxID=342944 RepID=A0A419UWL0_9BACL|nr:TIGR04104 family putative zinc finger protein [Sinobaca qinghaiensis]RKD69516.1 CXXC-20-CXXC protein [Sinobaca qinghaiensis]
MPTCMPTCTNCRRKWNYKQTLANLSHSGNQWNCPLCGETQYPTFTSMIRFALLYFLAAASLLVFLFLHLSFVQVAGVITVSYVLVFLIFPFALRLSSYKESPL